MVEAKPSMLFAPLFSRNPLPPRPQFAIASALAITFSLAVLNAPAGTVNLPYQIGTWEGFRPAAVTYTFDDDLPNQYAKAVPYFNSKGFKLTLFTVTTWLPGGSWSPVQTAASFGHEIASHTVTHPDLSTSTAAVVSNEVINSQTTINANVPGQNCLTLAYPYCNPPADKSIVSAHYIAARGCSGQLVPSTPPDFMNISSFVCGTMGLSQISDLNAKVDAAAAANEWCVFLIHAIDNDNGYSPLSSPVLFAHLNYVSANPDKFWVETFGHVVRYIRERNAASVAEISVSASSITVQVTDGLDDAIYNYPITLRRPLPANWPGAAVLQNNQAVASRVVNLNSTNYLMFDVVPDSGTVLISKLVLPAVVSNPVMTGPSSFAFVLTGQSGASYVIASSSDLVNWLPVQTNLLLGASSNITVTAPSTMQFYRVQTAP